MERSGHNLHDIIGHVKARLKNQIDTMPETETGKASILSTSLWLTFLICWHSWYCEDVADLCQALRVKYPDDSRKLTLPIASSIKKMFKEEILALQDLVVSLHDEGQEQGVSTDDFWRLSDDYVEDTLGLFVNEIRSKTN